jgi:hypothetical protein
MMCDAKFNILLQIFWQRVCSCHIEFPRFEGSKDVDPENESIMKKVLK